jgi:hypothetical protein
VSERIDELCEALRVELSSVYPVDKTTALRLLDELKVANAKDDAELRKAWVLFENCGAMREPDGSTGNGGLDECAAIIDCLAAFAVRGVS